MLYIQLFTLGGLGVLIRYFLTFLNQDTFSYGTLLANIVGSYLIGYIYSQNMGEGSWLQANKIILIVGFFGALTTFSSYALDCVKLLEKGSWFSLGVTMSLHNVLSIAACFIAVKQNT